MDKIGIGFIGARFAADLHAHALSKIRGGKCEIVAVCSKTKESAEAFARKFNIPHVYTDHRALLERKDVHLVTLPVVTSLHHTLAIDAADAGKHLIVEKPLTGCFADADACPGRRCSRGPGERRRGARGLPPEQGDAGLRGELRLRAAGGEAPAADRRQRAGPSSTCAPRRATRAPTPRTRAAG